MTREKIAEHAALVVMAVFRNIDQPGGAILAEATDLLTNFRRATLQEAARAVCKRCAQESPERDDQSADYWHPPSSYGSILCDASGIHDLIAALDKEVKP